MTLAESSGGLLAMERVRYPSSLEGIGDLRSLNLLGSGDGVNTFFLLDSWLPDGRLKDLAPHLFTLIPKRLSRVRLVRDALDGGWLDDIPPNLDVLVVHKLLAVADRVEGLTVIEGVADEFRWDWGANGVYSPKSCYLGMFRGNVSMPGALQVWKSRAPAKC
jgi:hypothetical protein